jgi:osmotically-inducible protein OsmY
LSVYSANQSPPNEEIILNLKFKLLKEDKMANEYDYRRGRSGRDYYDEPYYRSRGEGYEESYDRGERYDRGDRGYRGEPSRYEYGRGGYYSEPYRSRRSGRYYNEPYGDYDYERYEYGASSREPYYRRDYEGGYREPYSRGQRRRGGEDRGFLERAGDEIKSWFGDEEAERRRRMDEMRRGSKAGRGPRGYQRSDERIREDVNDRLTEDWYVDASDIEVSVNNGTVMLSGRVDSRDEKRRAEDIVESVTGVKDVSNQLSVVPSVPITTETTETTRARTART